MATREEILAAESWSVEFWGNAVNDARNVEGVWYGRNIITKDFEPLTPHNRVNPLFKNPQVGTSNTVHAERASDN